VEEKKSQKDEGIFLAGKHKEKKGGLSRRRQQSQGQKALRESEVVSGHL